MNFRLFTAFTAGIKAEEPSLPKAIKDTAVQIWLLVSAGDRGFDPLGLAKPQEYLQFDTDKLDQNKAVNKAGNLIGKYTPGVNTGNDTLAPYDDVFGLERFRETELIHGRWAMLATLGVLIGEASTGVSWSVLGHVTYKLLL